MEGECRVSRHHRGSLLWIIGRIGILFAFAIMPLQRACYRIKHPYVPSFDYTRFEYALSNANLFLPPHEFKLGEVNKWMAIADEELKKGDEWLKKRKESAE